MMFSTDTPCFDPILAAHSIAHPGLGGPVDGHDVALIGALNKRFYLGLGLGGGGRS